MENYLRLMLLFWILRMRGIYNKDPYKSKLLLLNYYFLTKMKYLCAPENNKLSISIIFLMINLKGLGKKRNGFNFNMWKKNPIPPAFMILKLVEDTSLLKLSKLNC